jgi:hypothetical protein
MVGPGFATCELIDGVVKVEQPVNKTSNIEAPSDVVGL